MQHRRSLAALVAAVAALLVASCAGTDGPDAGAATEPKTGGTVHFLQQTDFSYLDPSRGWDTGVNSFYRLIFRNLTAQAPGDSDDPNAIVPDLAESLGEVSDDGLTWTYTLKDGIAFDDGTPITSAEVEWGISRTWDPDVGGGSPYLRQVIAAPDGYEGPYVTGDNPMIETPDAKTIVFHLKAPFPEFDSVLAQVNGAPFPVGSGAGDEFIHDVPASGPYQIDEYVPGSNIRLTRNEHWDQATDDIRRAYPDAWEWEIGIDPATIDERMLAGQGTDANAIAGSVQPATLSRLSDPRVADRVINAPGFGTTFMTLNTQKTPFDDVRVRQAVHWALDKAAVQTATGGPQLAEIATSILPPNVNGHADSDVYASEGHTGDIEKAKELLAEAGLSDGFSFTLTTRAVPVAQAQAEAIQQSLADVGITVTLDVLDASTYWEVLGNEGENLEATIAGWNPDWASSASTFIPPLLDGENITDDANNNGSLFNDPEINARINEISAMTDIDAANVEWGKLDEEIMQRSPIVPLVWPQGVFLPGENITGFIPYQGFTDYTTISLIDPEST